MNILLIIAAIWGGFFLLSLALAAANSRVNAQSQPTKIDFHVNPALFSGREEDLQPLREIITSKLGKTSATKRRAERLAGEKEVIFVVDDDPDILDLIKHVLHLEGFEVRSFTDPELALEEFRAAPRKPEMIVTDFCMQPINGLELISRCRESVPELKTILISGMVDEDSVAKMPAKSDRFLHKPFKVSNLIQTLNDTLADARN